jgi:hypothetical protein
VSRVRIKLLVALSVDSEAYDECPDVPEAVALEVKRLLSEEGAFRGCGVKVSASSTTAPTSAALPQPETGASLVSQKQEDQP